jgi:polygalacturonase
MKNHKYTVCLILLFWCLSATLWSAGITSIHNVRDYGAVGEGKTLDTKAIQNAIDEAAKKGGKVYLPSGVYLSGSLRLRSNVTIEISEGATLLGSTIIKDYEENIPKIRSYIDNFLRYSLLYAEDAQNIAIIGRGIIDGQGGTFKVTTKKKPDRYQNRPYIIRFINCKNVLVENVRMQNSAMWMQHYFACDQVAIRGISVYNHCNKNNDMIDIDGCSNVLISDCIGDTDDDALTIKSTSDRISKNITVTNCILSSHCNAIKLGTESHGGFENIAISNCIVKPSIHPTKIYGFKNGISGITLGMVDGGRLDGVQISNIRIDGPKVAIYMRLGDRGRIFKTDMPRPGVGSFRNVMLSNIYATNADTIGCSITGLPDHPIEGITLDNIKLFFKGGSKNDIDPLSVKEEREHYPESTMFGKLPAYGFFIRHAKNISLNNIEMVLKTNDDRPVIVADDVHDFQISGLNAQTGLKTPSYLYLNNSTDVWIKDSQPQNKLDIFLKVSGKNSKNIIVSGNNLRKVREIFHSDVKHLIANIKMSGNIIK